MQPTKHAEASSHNDALLRRASQAIKNLKSRVADLESTRTLPLAITGVGLRLPGGIETPAALWSALEAGRSLIGSVPADRWGDPGPEWRGAFIDDLPDFDCGRYRMAPRVAALTDPRQRLLLEACERALTMAGIDRISARGSSTGLFVAAGPDEHLARLGELGEDTSDPVFLAGAGPANLAGRVAHHFGLRGPALVVDTACSASLVALDLACEALRAGHCQRAIVAGVQALLSRSTFSTLLEAGLVSRRGRCATFGAEADGFVRGEGVVALVLQRLPDAEADSSPVLGLIRGTAVNHDGVSASYGAPNQGAHEAVMRAALQSAGAQAGEVGYVEVHGTASAMGDLIELAAVDAVYGAADERGSPCVVGAHKPLFGHLEAAAGLLSVVKATLCLAHGRVSPNLLPAALNPELPLAPERLVLATSGSSLADGLAAVHAFGTSGTNGHALVGAAPQGPAGERGREALVALAVEPTFARVRCWLEPASGGERIAAEASVSGRRSFESEAALRSVVRRAVADVIGLTAEALDDDTPFTDFGLDSLSGVRLVRQLEAILGRSLAPSAIWSRPTVTALTGHVWSLQTTGGSSALGLSLAEAGASTLARMRADAVLEPDIRPSVVFSARWSTTSPTLLTGATGFVGAFLLAALLARGDAPVYCLVRAENPEAGRRRILDNLARYRLAPAGIARIEPVVGDLARPRLGLDREAWRELAESVDAIIHNGAHVNWLYPYATLAPATVEGTRSLLRLACEGSGAVFHHVSTRSVVGEQPQAGTFVAEHVPLDALLEGMGGGYPQSKWVAEKLVAAAFDRGLPGTLHRLPFVAGASDTGLGAVDDYLHSSIFASLELGAFPDDLTAATHPLPVDVIARVIVGGMGQPQFSGKRMHLMHPTPMPWSGWGEVLRSAGHPVEAVPFVEWRRRVRAALDAGGVSMLRPFEAWLFSPRLEEHIDLQPRFDTSVSDVLRVTLGVELPDVGDCIQAVLRAPQRGDATRAS